MSCEAAKIVSGQLYLKPQSVLGLATGSTPVGLYDKLVQLHETVGLDFSEVTTFNLDEYVGMPSENPESYHYFMKEHLFSRVNLRPDHCFVPNGMAEDLEEEGRRYDALIEQARSEAASAGSETPRYERTARFGRYEEEVRPGRRVDHA